MPAMINKQEHYLTLTINHSRIEKSWAVRASTEDVSGQGGGPPCKRNSRWPWTRRLKQMSPVQDGDTTDPSPLYLVIPLGLILFIVQFGYDLCDVPATRLTEDIICREFYRNYSTATGFMTYEMLNETLCNAAGPVQAELNFVAAGMAIASYVPGLAVALFSGMLCDSWGRRPVFWLCVSGMTLSNVLFAVICWIWKHGTIRIVWTSSLALFIGGGGSVAEGVVFAMLSDLSTDSNRATHFQIVIATVMLSQTLAPIAANSLMEVSVWLPLILGPSVATFGSFLMVFFPETSVLHTAREEHRHKPPIELSLRAARRDLKEMLRLFMNHKAVVLLLPAAGFTVPVATVAIGISLRYISLRFKMTLGHTGVLLGARTGFSVVVLIMLVPLVSYAMRRWWRPGTALNRDVHIGDVMKNDLLLAKIGTGTNAVGLAIFAAAPKLNVAIFGLLFFTLGSGVPSLTRAIMAELTERSHAGRLFAGLAILEMIGSLAVGVGLGAVFQAGIANWASFSHDVPSKANTYLALPLHVCALILLVISVPLWLTYLPERPSRFGPPVGSDSIRSKDDEDKPALIEPDGRPELRRRRESV